jgi:hypothetical protein
MALRLRILEYVRAHLADPGLSAAQIAARQPWWRVRSGTRCAVAAAIRVHSVEDHTEIHVDFTDLRD